MKKLLLITMVVLTTVLSAHRSDAQGTLEPLYLSISGDGTVSPSQNGQLLVVGKSYEMDATASAGNVFSGWQKVNVFTDTQYLIGSNGETNPPIISIIASLVPEAYSEESSFDFTMQSVTEIYNNPGVEEITESIGWQADFTPVPEPSSEALVVAGLTIIVLLRKRQATHRRFDRND